MVINVYPSTKKTLWRGFTSTGAEVTSVPFSALLLAVVGVVIPKEGHQQQTGEILSLLTAGVVF